MDIGGEIRRARKSKSITQEDLGGGVKHAREWVGLLERGDAKVSLNELRVIFDRIGLDVLLVDRGGPQCVKIGDYVIFRNEK